MNLVRSLYLAAALLTVAGLGLRLVPLRQRPVSAPPAPPTREDDQRVRVSAPLATGERDSAAAGAIIASNIFARTRVAPARVGAAPVATRRRVPSPAPIFTLYGTTIGPHGAVALIDASTTLGGAHLHQIGDSIGDARVAAITDSSVTLERPSGPLILHLPTSAARKP